MKKPKPEEVRLSEEALIADVCSYFGRIYDDREEERAQSLRGLQRERDHEKWKAIMGTAPTINETAEAFSLPAGKIRKLLIAGGMYNTALFRQINSLVADGMSVEDVAAVVGRKAGTVKSYLDYRKVIYNLDEKSKNAVRIDRFKEKRRQEAASAHEKPCDERRREN